MKYAVFLALIVIFILTYPESGHASVDVIDQKNHEMRPESDNSAHGIFKRKAQFYRSRIPRRRWWMNKKTTTTTTGMPDCGKTTRKPTTVSIFR